MAALHLELASRPDAIGKMIEAVEAFAAPLVPAGKALPHFLLALEEIASNAIRHGGVLPPADGPRITVTVGEHELVFEMVDDGLAFDPFTEAPPPDLSAGVLERPVGGLGVHLVKQLMDTWSYERRGGRNHTIVGKRLSGDRRAPTGA